MYRAGCTEKSSQDDLGRDREKEERERRKERENREELAGGPWEREKREGNKNKINTCMK